MAPYDAVLIVSFGGPEGPHEVMPFLENVLRGKNVPAARMLEVAEHYYHFGGVSPINTHCRALIAGLVQELNAHGPQLPVYWGNRNWHPLLPDTLRQMAADGITRALAFVTSAFSSYSGCRQYLENIDQARIAAAQPEAAAFPSGGAIDSASAFDTGSEMPPVPHVDKLRACFNHPGFIEPLRERLTEAFAEIPPAQRSTTPLIFTAHSIPDAMAATCEYDRQLREASRLVAEGVGRTDWELAFQSRSGPPSQPWLEPDILSVLDRLAGQGQKRVVVMPIGFLSDHMEVLYDLDIEAKGKCEELGMELIRAGTVGAHPRFVRMIRELILERIAAEEAGSVSRPTLGNLPPSPDRCPADCCRYTPRRPGS